MKGLTQQEDDAFENEVRRIARHLWPSAEYSGAAVVDSRERDGIFETEECIHIVEATTSRLKDKARTDVTKLTDLALTMRRRSPTKAVQCWFITRSEPTAEQREVVVKAKWPVNALSFNQFQSRLMDVATYLNAREDYPFGSVRDPATGKGKPATEYVQLDLVDNQNR